MNQGNSESKIRRGSFKFAIALLVVVLALGSFGVYEFALSRSAGSAPQSTSATSSGALGQNISLNAQLSVNVYNHGTLVGSAEVKGDLVMNNFMNWLQSWMVYETPSAAASTFLMTDTGGTLRGLYGRDSASTSG